MAPPPAVQPTPVADGSAVPVTRSAVVFVGGFGEDRVDQTAEGIARRLGDALDRTAATGAARFTVATDVNDVELGPGHRVQRATVVRTDPDGTTHALDVWGVPTAKALTSDYEASSPLVRALRGTLLIGRLRRPIRYALGKEPACKHRRDRAQLLVVRVAIALLVLYTAAMVVAFVAGFAQAEWMPAPVASVLIGLTGLGIWKAKAVARLARTATALTCLLSYLDHGYAAPRLAGRLSAVLEHLSEQDGVRYARLDVVAYSFGSLVALDQLFPRSGPPGPRFADVDALVTVGCPFDLVQTYWPAYFTGRHERAGAPDRWLNVFAPLDLFGSDFRTTGGEAQGIVTVDGAMRRPERSLRWSAGGGADGELTAADVLALAGLQAHAVYWSARYEQEATAFAPIASELYAGTPLSS